MAPFSGDEKEGLHSGQGLKGTAGSEGPVGISYLQTMKVHVWTLEAGRTSSVERSPS